MSSLKGPSEHLTWTELACKDGTLYPRKFILDGRVYRLAQVFENIRRVAGNHPIKIVSAFRTDTWNRKVNGASNSQHLHGRALDLHHTTLDNNNFYLMLMPLADLIGIRGIGLYTTFIHIDIRPTNKLIVWGGPNDETKTIITV